MPNFDGGHYFLSALIPIQEGLCDSLNGDGHLYSHTHALREILAALPTENTSGVDSDSDPSPQSEAFHDAPFSRNLATHFCRMAIVDDTTFVGRQPKNAILTALCRINPVIPEPVDQLPFSYLALIIDFDAIDGAEETLRNYLLDLWRVMEPELKAIFEHCQGYDLNRPQDSFVKIVMDSQLETTMSYNDYYWTGEPGYWVGSPSLQNKLPKIILLPLIVASVAFLVALLGGVRGWGLGLLFIGLVVVLIYWIYRRVLSFGMHAFPTAPRTDLPSVLKALYLQQQFIAFMIENQGVAPEALKESFAAFLATHKPSSIQSPSQSPGCIPT